MTERQWYAELGHHLRLNRVARGWTLYDVAALVGVSHAAVSRWERGSQRMQALPYAVLRREGLLP